MATSKISRQILLSEKGNICCNCQLLCEDNVIHFHHVIPKVLGGLDILSNIVPLCPNCHNKLHQLENSDGTLSHQKAMEIGRAAYIERCRKTGEHIGRPCKDPEIVEKAISLYMAGEVVHKIEKKAKNF